MLDKLFYPKPEIAAILAFVDIKIIISDYFEIPLPISFYIIFGIVDVIVILLMLRSKNIKRSKTLDENCVSYN
jgi:predicted tellurium resistance membrane protein TerC